MIKMVKVKWLKNWKERKIGDISNVAEKSAENFVSQGYAEYIKVKTKTPKSSFKKKPAQKKQKKESNKIFFDEDAVRRFYRFFRHKRPTEIRVFDSVKYPEGKSETVKNIDEFVSRCKFYAEEERVSVYIGARDREGRGEKNVKSSSFVLFEIDEHEEGDDKAKEKKKIIKFLEDNNITITMQGMSGGGWHFYILHNLVDFSDSDMALRYKEDSLTSFKNVMLSQGFDIDAKVFNLERVMRVLGTYNFKRDKLSEIEFINTATNAEENTKALTALIKKYGALPKTTTPTKKISDLNLDDDKFLKQVKEKWLEGDRQNLAICLAGYLRKKKRMGIDHVIQIIRGICNETGDTDVQERINGVKATFRKNEDEVRGEAGLEDLNIETNPKILEGKVPIELPGDNRYVSDFAKELAVILAGKKTIFWRQDSRQIIELGDIKNEKGEITHTGFIQITPGRFTTLVEKYFAPWTYKYAKNGNKYMVEKSMTKNDGSIVLESQILQETIPSINRIFNVQLPIIYDGELTFPKTGYDPRFRSWLPIDAGKIGDMNMPLEEAKGVLKEVYKEFCFESEQDYFNAISALITPFLRGLFKTGFNTRTPIYCYEANRERSGKDFCAGVTGMLYEGNALEEAPISSGEYRSSGGNDELRKKLISAMISGKKRLHFSNNKGHLNSAVFESVTTATKFTDRLLGKNVEVAFDNEMDFSFSGNLGMTLTPDLTNRTIFIKLFLEIEDANQRQFEKPNLHHWVLENRDKVLSALYSLVRNWFKKGSPDGTLPFASFPEWARVCGGIMEAAGYNSPCVRPNNKSGVSIDAETDEMKELFELCYKACPETSMTKGEIQHIIRENNLMTYLNWDLQSAAVKFGQKITKFKGRILSDIKMMVEDETIRPARWKYIFSKKFKTKKKEWRW